MPPAPRAAKLVAGAKRGIKCCGLVLDDWLKRQLSELFEGPLEIIGNLRKSCDNEVMSKYNFGVKAFSSCFFFLL